MWLQPSAILHSLIDCLLIQRKTNRPHDCPYEEEARIASFLRDFPRIDGLCCFQITQFALVIIGELAARMELEMGENALANEFGVQASHKGFYSEVDIEDALGKEDYSKRFECSGENEDDFIYSSATYLLEGECGSFALALQDTFGHLPYVVKSKKGKGFHAFYQVEKDGKLCFSSISEASANSICTSWGRSSGNSQT